MAERGRMTEDDGPPPHEALLHLHEHTGRPPSPIPHSHPHAWLPGDRWQHHHLHLHAYDINVLAAAAVTEPDDIPAVQVRSEHNASGFATVSTAVLVPDGTLQVTARFAPVHGGDEVIGYQCTVIEARLNGMLVTDPDRAKRLAARAGIPEPPAVTWIEP